MTIIRDNELGGIMMIPLLVDWDIRRCNVRDCKTSPNTIVKDKGAPIHGLCEDHFHQGNVPGGTTYTLEQVFVQVFTHRQNPQR